MSGSKEALEQYKKLIIEAPNNDFNRLILSSLYCQAEQFDDAKKHLNYIIDNTNRTNFKIRAFALRNIAAIQATESQKTQENNIKSIADQYNTAINTATASEQQTVGALEKQSTLIKLQLGMLYYKNSDFDSAERLFKDVLTQPVINFQKKSNGTSYDYHDDFFMTMFFNSSTTNSHTFANLALGDIYFARGNNDCVESLFFESTALHYENVLQKEPNNIEAKHKLAYTLYKKGLFLLYKKSDRMAKSDIEKAAQLAADLEYDPTVTYANHINPTTKDLIAFTKSLFSETLGPSYYVKKLIADIMDVAKDDEVKFKLLALKTIYSDYDKDATLIKLKNDDFGTALHTAFHRGFLMQAITILGPYSKGFVLIADKVGMTPLRYASVKYTEFLEQDANSANPNEVFALLDLIETPVYTLSSESQIVSALGEKDFKALKESPVLEKLLPIFMAPSVSESSNPQSLYEKACQLSFFSPSSAKDIFEKVIVCINDIEKLSDKDIETLNNTVGELHRLHQEKGCDAIDENLQNTIISIIMRHAEAQETAVLKELDSQPLPAESTDHAPIASVTTAPEATFFVPKKLTDEELEKRKHEINPQNLVELTKGDDNPESAIDLYSNL